MNKLKFMSAVIITAVIVLFPPVYSSAQKKTDSTEQIYVPVYSSIYHGNRDKVINLAVTLSIRNVDSVNSVTLYSIDYYSQSGALIRNYLNTAKVLKPYETLNIIIKENDTEGGNTSGFVVRWNRGKSTNELFVEAVMIGTYPQGISFTSRGIKVSK